MQHESGFPRLGVVLESRRAGECPARWAVNRNYYKRLNMDNQLDDQLEHNSNASECLIELGTISDDTKGGIHGWGDGGGGFCFC